MSRRPSNANQFVESSDSEDSSDSQEDSTNLDQTSIRPEDSDDSASLYDEAAPRTTLLRFDGPSRKGRVGQGKGGRFWTSYKQQEAAAAAAVAATSNEGDSGTENMEVDDDYDGPLNIDYIVREYAKLHKGGLKNGIDVRQNIIALCQLLADQRSQVKNWHFFTMKATARKKMAEGNTTHGSTVPDLGYRKILNYYFEYTERRRRGDVSKALQWWPRYCKEQGHDEFLTYDEKKQSTLRTNKMGHMEEVLFRFLCNKENLGLGCAFLLKIAEAAGPENLEVLRRTNSPLFANAREYLLANWNMWSKRISLPTLLFNRFVMALHGEDAEDTPEICQAYRNDRQRFCLDGDSAPRTRIQRMSNIGGQVGDDEEEAADGALVKYLTYQQADEAAKKFEDKVNVLKNQLAAVEANIAETVLEIKKHKKLKRNAKERHMVLYRRYKGLRKLDKATRNSKVREETELGMLAAFTNLMKINIKSGCVTEEDIMNSVKSFGINVLDVEPQPGTSRGAQSGLTGAASTSSSLIEQTSVVVSDPKRPPLTVEQVSSALTAVKKNLAGAEQQSGNYSTSEQSIGHKSSHDDERQASSSKRDKSNPDKNKERDGRHTKSHSSKGGNRGLGKDAKNSNEKGHSSGVDNATLDADDDVVHGPEGKENQPRKTLPTNPLENLITKKPRVETINIDDSDEM